MSAPHGPGPDPQAGASLQAEHVPGARDVSPDVDMEESTWIRDGIVSGVVGATVIALFFLVIDLLGGRPLWTPHALGSAVFFGETVPDDASPVPYIVVGYTVLHGAVFLIAGLTASFAMLGRRDDLGPLSGLALAGALFLGLELFFLAFFATFADSVAGELFADLGTGKIAVANMLAAGTMAATTVRSPLPR